MEALSIFLALYAGNGTGLDKVGCQQLFFN
jgi:hypothetical protein